jgi:hypothetical protein
MCNALRLAALDGHDERVRVAVVLAGEGDPLAIAGEVRVGFRARKAGESLGITAGATHDPQVICVGEDDVLIAHRRLAEELRALRGSHSREEQERREEKPKT